MSQRYTLTWAAKRDLEEIYAYTYEEWGLPQAEKYTSLLLAGIERVTNNPALGRTHDNVPKPYLVYQAESHLIIYRSAKPVEVLNILHPAMDIGARLRGTSKRVVH